jgi:hypothetical protein
MHSPTILFLCSLIIDDSKNYFFKKIIDAEKKSSGAVSVRRTNACTVL